LSLLLEKELLKICQLTICQEDIDNLERWSEIWKMPFNILKCESLHLGCSNQITFILWMVNVFNKPKKRILTENQLKFHSHFTAVTSKARRLLGLIGKLFINLNFQTLPYLYKVIVRPTLEYGNIIWGPFHKGDENLIKQIQRKATRLVTSISHLSYEEQLRHLNLPSLNYRRYHGDIISCRAI